MGLPFPSELKVASSSVKGLEAQEVSISEYEGIHSIAASLTQMCLTLFNVRCLPSYTSGKNYCVFPSGAWVFLPLTYY